MLALYLLILLLILLVISIWICLGKKNKNKIVHINPDVDTWFNRSDGAGLNVFNKDGIYLTQTVTPQAPYGNCPCDELKGTCRGGKCYSYTNSEIYNNPCCKSGVTNWCSQIQTKSDLICDVIGDACSGSWSENSPCHMYRSEIGDPWASSFKNWIKSGFLNIPYRYYTMEAKIKVTGIKGGSRGWGFWNTVPQLKDLIIIWFMHQDGILEDGSPYPLNGFYAQVINGTNKPVIQKLPNLDEKWHIYKIVWTSQKIEMYIDSKKVFSLGDNIPNGQTALHVWVDNAVFGADSNGLFKHINQILEGNRSQSIEWLTLTQN